jgi:hypothetical protein
MKLPVKWIRHGIMAETTCFTVCNVMLSSRRSGNLSLLAAATGNDFIID